MSEKLEAMDFALSFIIEHEKKLDGLIERLEEITPMIEKELNK